MSDWKRDAAARKVDQRTPVELLRKPPNTKRRPREWLVVGPPWWPQLMGPRDYVYYRGHSREACEAYIAKERRTHQIAPAGLRIVERAAWKQEAADVG